VKHDPAHYGFRCGAQCGASAEDHAPTEKPRCVKCDTPFLVKDKGRFLHYRLFDSTDVFILALALAHFRDD
jgi:DNA-directed RNA polymerase subunit RPC12/RpoP